MIDENIVVFARASTRSLHKEVLISTLEDVGGLVHQLLLRDLGRITLTVLLSFVRGLVWLCVFLW